MTQIEGKPPVRPADQFWMVWRESSGDTRYPHFSYKAAQDEAERLANKNPGEIFYVLKAMCGRISPILPAQKVKMLPLAPSFEDQDDDDDGIPF